ncbi:MAG: DNA alkylation repair protein [Planctomycetes bacterium]|nr:DNA alkylation repair protein [Planctomycetota bacterium]
MAEPFKNLVGPQLVRDLGHHLARVWPDFDRARFERTALDGLGALELKARAEHVSRALEAVLPANFDRAAGILERSLLPARLDDDLQALRTDERGLAGIAVWPMGDFVARAGLAHPARALRALHALTQRFSAEYAIRPFLLRHRELTFAVLRQWVSDPNPHVRRLVSEGSRPRLPWGVQLKFLIDDPSPALPLLQALQGDPSDYVRRSVANHWNDVGKDHPALVADWLERTLPGASVALRALCKHASRTLVKRGDRRVLAVWGLGAAFRGEVAFTIAPRRVAVGGAVTLTVRLRSASSKPQRLVVDYKVHHVTARGSTSVKVRKGWVVQLAPREVRLLTKQHSLAVVTTRRYHAGEHAVDLLVNGRAVARAAFVLVGASRPAR